MTEQLLSQIQAAVYQYNDSNWQNTDAGMSVVGLYYNPDTGLYRIVGLDAADNQVTINSALVPAMQYQRASERFHQFTDHLNTVYGLNFASDEEAHSFGDEVEKALQLLVQAASTEDPADTERRALEIEAERFAAQKLAEEEEQRKREEEQKRKEQEEQKRKEQERKKKLEEERKKKEEEERRKKEEEERKKKEAERKRKEEEERKRKEEEERRRREQEEEERRRQEEEEAERQRAEEEARRQQEEEERRRQEEEEERQRQEEEERRRREEEERKKKEAAKKAAPAPAAVSKPGAKPGGPSPATGRPSPPTPGASTAAKLGSLRGNQDMERFKAEMMQAFREELDAWKANLIQEIQNM